MSRIYISDAFAFELRKMILHNAKNISITLGEKGNQEMMDVARNRQVCRQFLDVYFFQPFRRTVFIAASIIILLFVDPLIGLVTGITILVFVSVIQVYMEAIYQKGSADATCRASPGER